MDPTTQSWLAFGMAALSTVGTIVGLTTAAVVKIAQARSDKRTAQLETENATLKQESAECKEARKKCEEKHTDFESRLSVLEAAKNPD